VALADSGADQGLVEQPVELLTQALLDRVGAVRLGGAWMSTARMLR
jgi:hypothetical protein